MGVGRRREETGARGDIGIWPSAAVIEIGEIGETTRAAMGEPGPLTVVTAGRGWRGGVPKRLEFTAERPGEGVRPGEAVRLLLTALPPPLPPPPPPLLLPPVIAPPSP